MDIFDIVPELLPCPNKSGKLEPVAVNVKYCIPSVFPLNLAELGTPLDEENPILP